MPHVTVFPATSPNFEYEDYILESDNATETGAANETIFRGANVFAFDDGNTSSLRKKRDMYFMSEMQRYDGWYNNLAHPRWGSTGKWQLVISAFNLSVH